MNANSISLVPLTPVLNSHPQSGATSLESFDNRDNIDNSFALLQAGGGKHAWLFLAGSFVVEALVWGKLKGSFAVLYDPGYRQELEER